ncbi:MAG: tRNA (guanosine(46)-N7)-methyltransferase TrmB, partial [Pseudomonadota bacterium]
MEQLLPRVRAPDFGDSIDPRALFPGAREVWFEIGFGGGEHMAAQARANPDIGVIGAEPFINGVAKALVAMDE